MERWSTLPYHTLHYYTLQYTTLHYTPLLPRVHYSVVVRVRSGCRRFVTTARAPRSSWWVPRWIYEMMGPPWRSWPSRSWNPLHTIWAKSSHATSRPSSTSNARHSPKKVSHLLLFFHFLHSPYSFQHSTFLSLYRTKGKLCFCLPSIRILYMIENSITRGGAAFT